MCSVAVEGKYGFDIRAHYEEHVRIAYAEKSKVLKSVEPIVRDISTRVSKSSRNVFNAGLACIGSHYQGLKTSRTDEFDYNVSLNGMRPFHWGGRENRPEYITYGFEAILSDEEAKTTTKQGLQIVQKRYRIKPEIGFIRVPFPGNMTDDFSDLMFDGDLVPYLVKMKYLKYLKQECNDLQGVVLHQQPHGPALTIVINAHQNDLPYDVSVDFAPIYEARLPYRDVWGWPRPNARWPTPEMILKIKSKTVNLTAKQNFFWMISFALMEKELCKNADSQGECRKKVHKLMKVLFKKHWRHGPSLSSYELKNSWLWYCESVPDSRLWVDEHFLGARFDGCVQHFRSCLLEKKLPQYFYPNKNLLQGKISNDLQQTAKKIDDFLVKHGFK